jgi:hypothetical protein
MAAAAASTCCSASLTSPTPSPCMPFRLSLMLPVEESTPLSADSRDSCSHAPSCAPGPARPRPRAQISISASNTGVSPVTAALKATRSGGRAADRRNATFSAAGAPAATGLAPGGQYLAAEPLAPFTAGAGVVAGSGGLPGGVEPARAWWAWPREASGREASGRKASGRRVSIGQAWEIVGDRAGEIGTEKSSEGAGKEVAGQGGHDEPRGRDSTLLRIPREKESVLPL